MLLWQIIPFSSFIQCSKGSSIFLSANLSSNYQAFAEDVWEGFGSNYDFNYPDSLPTSAAHYFSDYKPRDDAEDIVIAKPPIYCKPKPGKSLLSEYQALRSPYGNDDELFFEGNYSHIHSLSFAEHYHLLSSRLLKGILEKKSKI